MAPGRADPYLANRFSVALELDGIHEANFAEVTGLVVETEVEERHEGGLNQYAHRLPKGSKVANIVLKRGLTDSDRLWNWHQQRLACSPASLAGGGASSRSVCCASSGT